MLYKESPPYDELSSDFGLFCRKDFVYILKTYT